MEHALAACCLAALLSSAAAQQPGKVFQEVHPKLETFSCSADGCCKDDAMITIDANWRWAHDSVGYDNCFSSDWDPEYCPDSETCSLACAIEGADTEHYDSWYGISTQYDTLKMKYITETDDGTNIGSRVYLMQGGAYKVYKLKNREFSFDVDVSTLGCGINGALYFVEMPADGDYAKGHNKAGAHYGTGYCDATCPRDIKWVDGFGNVPYRGIGNCCAEVDVWEANIHSTVFTMHPCKHTGAETCAEDKDCGPGSSDGKCDADGCDFNAHRLGNKTFYGSGSTFAIDTSKPFTVTTQFVTSDGTDDGDLVSVKRIYSQGMVQVENAVAANVGEGISSISSTFCDKEKAAFGDPDDFGQRGGLKAIGEAMDRGMVLAMSITDDPAGNMAWLDGTPKEGDASAGSERGDCEAGAGDVSKIRESSSEAYVNFAAIRFGAIGTTGGASVGACPGAPTNTYEPDPAELEQGAGPALDVTFAVKTASPTPSPPTVAPPTPPPPTPAPLPVPTLEPGVLVPLVAPAPLPISALTPAPVPSGGPVSDTTTVTTFTDTTATWTTQTVEGYTLSGDGVGCENWMDVAIGDATFEVDQGACAKRCDANVSCVGFGFQPDDLCSGEKVGAGACFLWRGTCSTYANDCWSHYAKALAAPGHVDLAFTDGITRLVSKGDVMRMPRRSPSGMVFGAIGIAGFIFTASMLAVAAARQARGQTAAPQRPVDLELLDSL